MSLAVTSRSFEPRVLLKPQGLVLLINLSSCVTLQMHESLFDINVSEEAAPHMYGRQRWNHSFTLSLLLLIKARDKLAFVHIKV